MRAPGLRLSLALAVASAGGCASAGRAIGGADLEQHVLAHAGLTKLAAALATDLINRPADDPLRLSPQMAGLRGLLDAPAAQAAVAAPAMRVASVQPAAFMSPIAFRVADLAAPMPPGPALAAMQTAPAAPPPAPKKQVFAVALGKFDDAAIAASVWGELSAADPLAVKGLAPRLAAGKAGMTLLAGPIEDEDTALGRCTAFKALGVECAPAAYQGKPLAGAGA
ncbi:MAG: hypothetical protein ABUS57_21125 [Pseudomonadota bacterium]